MRYLALIGAALAITSTGVLAQQAEDRNILLWPMPETVSPEGRAAAEASARSALPDPLPPIEVIRAMVDAMQKEMGAQLQDRYEVRVEDREIAGVPVRVVYPKGVSEIGDGPVLLNLHGGGGKLDSGSFTETIPIAGKAKIPVVAVLYRLAPEHPYPARLNDALAVYEALESGRTSENIGIYGTSAGAVLSAQLVSQLRENQKPMPAVMGFFSGTADASKKGDSESWVPTPGGELEMEKYTATPLTDPVLSPVYGDLSEFPPTLLMTSTRDLALSGTANFGRELVKQGVDAHLVVFDALPHAFWAYMPNIPETEEANSMMAEFLASHLTR